MKFQASRSKLVASIVLLNVTFVGAAFWFHRPAIAMPEILDMGNVPGDATVRPTLVIHNQTGHEIRCLGAAEACGFGCYKAESLPAAIPAYGSLSIILNYHAPTYDSMSNARFTDHIAENRMEFYFDVKGEPRKLVTLRCRVTPEKTKVTEHRE